MIVRCGACRTSFDVAGAGRHRCPACGATNKVTTPPPGGMPAAEPGGPVMPGGQAAAAPDRPPARISEVVCAECSWDFIVGDVEVAICPNCRAEVRLGAGEDAP